MVMSSLSSLVLDLFDPYFYKTLDPIGSNFLLRAERSYQRFGEVSSVPGGGGGGTTILGCHLSTLLEPVVHTCL